MGNARQENFRAPLEKLASHPEPVIAECARWALQQLETVRQSPGTKR
jgi:epoxyqueuosine reductase QueG